MARKRALEETLQALRRVREEPGTEASRTELRRVLTSEGAHAVARAASLVAELELEPLVPELVAAFPRFFADLPKSDPGCGAKTAIVEALRRLGQDQGELYRRAARHVQMEPVFGGRVDTAVDLRGAAALALAEHRRPRRAGAARGAAGRPGAARADLGGARRRGPRKRRGCAAAAPASARPRE